MSANRSIFSCMHLHNRLARARLNVFVNALRPYEIIRGRSTQAFLTFSEVIGHVDLLVNERGECGRGTTTRSFGTRRSNSNPGPWRCPGPGLLRPTCVRRFLF